MAIDSLLVWCQSECPAPAVQRFNAPFLQSIGFRDTLVARANSGSLSQQRFGKTCPMLKSCQVPISFVEAISNQNNSWWSNHIKYDSSMAYLH